MQDPAFHVTVSSFKRTLPNKKFLKLLIISTLYMGPFKILRQSMHSKLIIRPVQHN
jgi:hypothetical protein